MRQCQLGALTWSASNQKAVLDQRWCYVCGICRAVCKRKAIALVERPSAPQRPTCGEKQGKELVGLADNFRTYMPLDFAFDSCDKLR